MAIFNFVANGTSAGKTKLKIATTDSLFIFNGISFAMTSLSIFNTNFNMPRVDKIGLAFETYSVYIMTNQNNTVLYTGVTSELRKRCIRHRNKMHPDSFKDFCLSSAILCVVFSLRPLREPAVENQLFNTLVLGREKQIKAVPGKKKSDLIRKDNPLWNDLFETKLAADWP